MLYNMVASSTSDCIFCNKVINLGAQSFKCKVGGWELEKEQLKGRCKLRLPPLDE